MKRFSGSAAGAAALEVLVGHAELFGGGEGGEGGAGGAGGGEGEEMFARLLCVEAAGVAPACEASETPAASACSAAKGGRSLLTFDHRVQMPLPNRDAKLTVELWARSRCGSQGETGRSKQERLLGYNIVLIPRREQDRPPSSAEYALLGPQGHGISGKVLLTMHCRPAAAVVGPGGVLGRVLSAALRSKSQRSNSSLRREDPLPQAGAARAAGQEPRRQASLVQAPPPSHHSQQPAQQQHQQQQQQQRSLQQGEGAGPSGLREDEGCAGRAPLGSRPSTGSPCFSRQLSGLSVKGEEGGAALDGALLDMAPRSGDGPLGSGALGVHLLWPQGAPHSAQAWAELDAQLGDASPGKEAALGTGTAPLSAPVPISSKPSKSNSGPLTAGGALGLGKAKSRSGPLARGRKGSRQGSRREEGEDAAKAGVPTEEGAEAGRRGGPGEGWGSAQAVGAPGASQGAPAVSEGAAATLGVRWGGDLEAMAFWQTPTDSAQVALSPPRKQHWNAVYHHTQSLNQLGTSPGSDSGSFHSQGSAEEVSSNQRRVEEAEAEMKAAAAAAAERQVRSRSSASVGTPPPFAMGKGSAQWCREQGPGSGSLGPPQQTQTPPSADGCDHNSNRRNRSGNLGIPIPGAGSRRSLAFSGPLAFAAAAGAPQAHPRAMPLPAALPADVLAPGGDLWEDAGGGRWGLGVFGEEGESEEVLGGMGGAGSRCTGETQEGVGEGHGPTEQGAQSEWGLKPGSRKKREMGATGREEGPIPMSEVGFRRSEGAFSTGEGRFPVSGGGFLPPPRPNRSMSEELWARGGAGKQGDPFRSGPLAHQGSHPGGPAPPLPYPTAADSPLAALPKESLRAALPIHRGGLLHTSLDGAGAPGVTRAGDARSDRFWAPAEGPTRRGNLWNPEGALGPGPAGMPKAMSDELHRGTQGLGWRAGQREEGGERPEELHLSGPLVMQSAPWGGGYGSEELPFGGAEEENESENESAPAYDGNEEMMPLEKSESGTRGGGGLAGGGSPSPQPLGCTEDSMLELEKSESGMGAPGAHRWGTRFSEMEWEGEGEDVWAPVVAPPGHHLPPTPTGHLPTPGAPAAAATAAAGMGAGGSGPRAEMAWRSGPGSRAAGAQAVGGRFSSWVRDPAPVAAETPGMAPGGRFCSGAYDPVCEFDDSSPCVSPHGGSQGGGSDTQEGPFSSPSGKHSLSQPLNGSPPLPFPFPHSVNHCGHSAPLPGTAARTGPAAGQEGSPSPTFLFPGNVNHCGHSAPFPGGVAPVQAADAAAPVPMEADCMEENGESQFGIEHFSALASEYGQGKTGLEWGQHEYDYGLSK